MSNFNNNYLKTTQNFKNQNNNIRKIDYIDFGLAKRSHDKLLKSSNLYKTLNCSDNKNLKGIDIYNNKKNNFNETNINKNEISSSINTVNNINNNHNLYKTAANIFSSHNFDKNKLEYLKFNSMNEVLNNLDTSNKEYYIKLKNQFHKKKKDKNLSQKQKSLPKDKKIKNLKLQNKNNIEKDNLTNYDQGFYYNKSLGCRINFKKIMLEENSYSAEKTPTKKISSHAAIPKLSPVKKKK